MDIIKHASQVIDIIKSRESSIYFEIPIEKVCDSIEQDLVDIYELETAKICAEIEDPDFDIKYEQNFIDKRHHEMELKIQERIKDILRMS